MTHTRVCRLLGIQYPILQGGMLWLADAKLAAAVSNSGALGVISPYAGMAKDGDLLKNLTAQIKKVRGLTKKPFGVNIPLDLEQSGLFINALLMEGVRIVITAAQFRNYFISGADTIALLMSKPTAITDAPAMALYKRSILNSFVYP